MHYIAINQYRGAAESGFANTWYVRRVISRTVQNRLLTEGLPVNDQWNLQEDGKRTRLYSTIGIRLASRSEIRCALSGPLFFEVPPID